MEELSQDNNNTHSDALWLANIRCKWASCKDGALPCSLGGQTPKHHRCTDILSQAHPLSTHTGARLAFAPTWSPYCPPAPWPPVHAWIFPALQGKLEAAHLL